MAVASWGAAEYDRLSWNFLRSEFARATYANWPIERRLDAYLRHHGLLDLINDGTAYTRLLRSVMDNIGPAHRRGILDTRNPDVVPPG
ncbi:MAG: hypothetical protein AB7G47_11865 [Mycolicibacterium sp.]|uniref:hypothetical protein n=1 Tax=Mycolicibacterium sp. TaxID=2320850 RepID=UPI003D0F637F